MPRTVNGAGKQGCRYPRQRCGKVGAFRRAVHAWLDWLVANSGGIDLARRHSHIRLAHMRVARVCLAMAMLAVAGNAGHAEPVQISPCDAAASRASVETGVPIAVLRAITRAETGRGKGGQLVPWPWTVNMEGHGRWFGTRAEAMAYVEQEVARGARSFDVGCFQINHKWHGAAFTSLGQMFEPLENARYAARFLSDLRVEFGDWSAAAGAYHSRTPELAKRYIARFDRIKQSLPVMPRVTAAADALAVTQDPGMLRVVRPRKNAFPLLRVQDAATGTRGSLVPLTSNRRGALFPLDTGS